jgi:Na+-translocating ferredoxin:NAD+ oxidoreductase subunit G
MTHLQSTFLNLIVTLAVITLVAALSLGYVYQWTKEPIAQAQLARQMKAIATVIPGYDNNPVMEKYKVATPDGTDSLEFFPARKGAEQIGVAIKSKSSKGYSGDIIIMTGFSMKGEILNVVVIEHKETPGLGSKMSSPRFVSQFIGKLPEVFRLKVKKDGGDVDAITGATISSRAYSDAVRLAYDTFKSSTDHGLTR